MKKIVMAGGTGFLGKCIVNYYSDKDVQCVILTRGSSRLDNKVKYVNWDGKTQGAWTAELDHADVLINLNGKSVDCRYTEKNKQLIYATRLDATTALGTAIQNSKHPPKLWINSGSATIYRHSLDKDMDEYTGEAGQGFSVDVCEKWESLFNSYATPGTRKVIIRTGIVLGRKRGALQPLKRLVQFGLGGTQGNGNHYFSWLHEDDFAAIIDFIITHTELNGAYNLTSPHPVPNHHFMKALRHVQGASLGIPAPVWLLKIGAVLIQTETELILKSRRVVPRKLLEAGYQFRYDTIEKALLDLRSPLSAFSSAQKPLPYP
ncbi:MAG: TIGR01777 family protein [Azospira oryzae]|jgi:uncharacterized protein (TIGR01777 family)|nr:MAG: TIGR01777 family protein [Azospira oryzae]